METEVTDAAKDSISSNMDEQQEFDGQAHPAHDAHGVSLAAVNSMTAFNASAGTVPPEFVNMNMFPQQGGGVAGNIFMNPSFPDLWDMLHTNGYGSF